MSARIEIGLSNFKKAVTTLDSFLATPVVNDRDQAGVIQAFEWCYEACWLTLKKSAEERGLRASTPIDAFRSGFQMNFIRENEHSTWLEIKNDGSKLSYIYDELLANEVFSRIQNFYLSAFKTLLSRMEGEGQK